MGKLEEINDEGTKPRKKSIKKSKEQSFIILKSLRYGSNKDGSPKEIYVEGKTITLSDKNKISKLKSLNLIK